MLVCTYQNVAKNIAQLEVNLFIKLIQQFLEYIIIFLNTLCKQYSVTIYINPFTPKRYSFYVCANTVKY